MANTSTRISDIHDRLRTLLIDANSPEVGDVLLDEICALFNYPDTNESNTYATHSVARAWFNRFGETCYELDNGQTLYVSLSGETVRVLTSV